MKQLLGPTIVVLTSVLVLEVYFVRELLAAELLFALGFAALFVLGGLVYLFGSIAGRSLAVVVEGVRVVGDSVRSGSVTWKKSAVSQSAFTEKANLLMSKDPHQDLHGTFYAIALNSTKSSM